MKLAKIIKTLFVVCLLSVFVQAPVLADYADDDDISVDEKIASVGFGKFFVSDSQKEIENVFKKVDTYTEKKDLKRLRRYFSDDFINNDGYDIDAYMKSLKNSFTTYENNKVHTEIKNITVSDDFAVAHVVENGEAETVKIESGIEGKGLVLVRTDIFYYLKREGREWKISSATVMDENCSILFGAAKNVFFSLNVPTQVKSGSQYTASLSYAPLKDIFYMASITSEPILSSPPYSGEAFKNVKHDGILERIMTANTDGYNEYVISYVGMSKVNRVAEQKIGLQLVGTAFIVRRVNVFKPMPQKLPSSKKIIFKKNDDSVILAPTLNEKSGDK